MADGGMNKDQLKPKRISFKRAARDFFFTPGTDPGLSRLTDDPLELRFRDPAVVSGFPLSAYDSVNDEIEKIIRHARNMKTARQAIEIPAITVVMEDAFFQESYRAIGKKWVLSGASGTRLRNRHVLKNPADGPDRTAAVTEYLTHARDGCHLPVYAGSKLPGDLPFVIECRNRFNYFHFLTETLCNLCAAAAAPTTGPIIIHYPGGKEAGFPEKFIEALFPDIAHRVEFRSTPTRYPLALGVFEIDHYLFQAQDEVLPSIDDVMPSGWIGEGRAPGPQSQAILARNAVPSELLALRARAHRLAAEGDYSHLPTRFWVARSASGARARHMKNEAKLVRQLHKLGFETVYFEKLSPLEQVAIMANAEMMMSYHGAGFANMMFAGSDTHVIEIGHLQTSILRWCDFIPLAHVAGCKYTSFFADFYKEDPENIPAVRHRDLLPVALSDDGVDQLAAFAANALGEKRRRRADTDVKRLATRLNDAKEWDGLRRLLEENWDLVEQDATLLVHMANCAGDAGDVVGLQRYLDMSWALDQTRPALLERLIKMSRRRKDWQQAQELLATHKTLFPDRDTDFTGQPLNRP